MPPRNRAEAEKAFEELSRLEFNFRREDSGLDQAAKYVNWLYAFALVIAVCASTSGVALYNISQQKLELEKSNIRQERFRDIDDEYRNKFQYVETLIDRNREERRSQLAALELQILELVSRKKEHDIMWAMKENGRSNKEEYMRINHIAAPDIPEK